MNKKIALKFLLLSVLLVNAPAWAEESAVESASSDTNPAVVETMAADTAAVESVEMPVTAVETKAEEAEPAAPAITLDHGDTAWMMMATALVLLMTIPGLALFYGGMVRKKNVLSTVMQSFAITCLISVVWMVAGYSIAFTPGNGFAGGLSKAFLSGVGVNQLWPGYTIPEIVFCIFQMTFAIITPALIAGAFAERMKFSALLIFVTLWSLLVYAPIAHWVWEGTGWLFTKGMLDFAGGTVVHINAGVAGLVCAYVLGKRVGFGKEAMMPHNLVLTIIGASLLWVGWFGFNAGSWLAADGRAGMAMAVTQIAAASAALSWMFVEWFKKGEASVLGIASGAVAGLVAITPASGFVDPMGALVIGLIAGVTCYLGATVIKNWLGADDSLDAFGVHGVGGILGALLTGVFATETITGGVPAVLPVAEQLMVQITGTAATIAYCAVVTFVLLKLIDVVIGLRVTVEEERQGLDLSLHRERVE